MNHFTTYEELGNLLKQCGNDELSSLFLHGFKENKIVTSNVPIENKTESNLCKMLKWSFLLMN